MNPKRIVVLDGFTLNPGDLNWEELSKLGECRIYDRTPADLTLERASGAEIILTNKTVLTREHLAALPDLKYIGVLATGYNVVDIEAARMRNIPVTNVPAYSTPSVVQLTFALILELTHHVGSHGQSVVEGRWSRSRDFCYWDYPLLELQGLTIGLVGCGNIGLQVVRVAAAFDMNVIACTASGKSRSESVRIVDQETLFREADIVSLHCPLTENNRGLINKQRLELMKSSALLINTSRGPLIVEKDLADALNEGMIAGAGLDVLSTEPPSPDNPLLSARNCIITPHVGWATKAARTRLMRVAAENVRAFLQGRPQNVVNPA